MAKESKEVIGKKVTEQCTAEVELIRTVGTFENDDGEVVEYCSYSVVVNGAKVKINFDSNVKNLIDTFVPFEELEDVEE